MKNLISLLIFVLLATSQVFFSGAWASTHLEHTDTLVHTLDEQGQAALKPIASLKVGDKVLAKSEWKAEGESLSYEPITDVMVTPAQPRRVVDIWLEDGTHLTATVREMRSRWGSLSPGGQMTLNSRLVQAPRPCIEYVIVHELCHITHRDHDAGFYSMLRQIMPDWQTRKHRLEQSLL
ncbi:MAG: YgjP-like metallopeptidase domain-containing protein [Burkholderiales bacterium]